MVLATDTREQQPLEFLSVKGVEYRTETLPTGDYGAWHEQGGEQVRDTAVVERKSLPDLFSSFCAGYERERNKILRAKELGLSYILTIEGTFAEVLSGHAYFDGTDWQEARKTGLSLIKQLMTCQRKYGIQVWWCASRKEMAFRIQEFFLASERVKESP